MLCTFCRIWHFFYQDQNQTKRNNTLQKQKNPIFTSCEFSSQIPNCARSLRTGGWRVVMLPLPLLGDGGWSPCPGPPHSHNGSPAPSARQAQPGDPRLSCCLHFGNHIDKQTSLLPTGKQGNLQPENRLGAWVEYSLSWGS